MTTVMILTREQFNRGIQLLQSVLYDVCLDASKPWATLFNPNLRQLHTKSRQLHSFDVSVLQEDGMLYSSGTYYLVGNHISVEALCYARFLQCMHSIIDSKLGPLRAPTT